VSSLRQADVKPTLFTAQKNSMRIAREGDFRAGADGHFLCATKPQALSIATTLNTGWPPTSATNRTADVRFEWHTGRGGMVWRELGNNRHLPILWRRQGSGIAP